MKTLKRKILAFFALLMIFMTPVAFCYDYRGEDDELRTYIVQQCRDFDIPPELVYAIIEKESTWDADAVNGAGNCFGLMQISSVNLNTLNQTLGISDLYDPYQNVAAGMWMINNYIDRYDDYNIALMCYNCGEGGAMNLIDSGVYSTAYSRSVINRMNELMGNTCCEEENDAKITVKYTYGADKDGDDENEDTALEINPFIAANLAVDFQEDSVKFSIKHKK